MAAALVAGLAEPAEAQQLRLRFVEPSGPLDHYVDARAADLLGQQDRAAERYVDWVRASTAPDAEMEQRAASAAIAAGRFDLARQIAGSSASPDEFGLDLRLLQLADTLREQEYGEALSILIDEDARIGLDFIEPFVRGWIDAETRSTDHARRAARRIAGLPEERALFRQQAEQAAFLYLAAGDVEEAARWTDPALSAAGPRETRLKLAFADRFATLGRPDLATAILGGTDPILERARSRIDADEPLDMAVATPAEALSELLLGIALDIVRSGNQGEMPLLLAQVARAAAPDNDYAAILTGALLSQAGRPDAALALYGAIPPSSLLASQARDSEVQALVAADRPADAVRVARAALAASDRPTPGDHARLGDALSAAGNHADAADAYAYARGDRRDDWQLYFLEAAQREQADEWPAARSLFQHALALAPDQPLVLNYLGYAMLEAGEDTGLASAFIRKASALSPDSPAITDSLGWALYKIGDVDGAIEALARASQQAPSDPEIHEHYGDALFAAGHRMDARFAWNAALVYADEDAARTRIEDKIAYGLAPANAAP
ncbi:tetratricopeptide repeat protein [Sphingomicrobium sp. XHP0239]|uniref:tetratricopeptide repeat protein n=1 Tax=Sphingomicrobium maritimum TaxID=3133972 RepID=UPI0031CC501E